jgi:hypothetical protein
VAAADDAGAEGMAAANDAETDTAGADNVAIAD